MKEHLQDELGENIRACLGKSPSTFTLGKDGENWAGFPQGAKGRPEGETLSHFRAFYHSEHAGGKYYFKEPPRASF